MSTAHHPECAFSRKGIERELSPDGYWDPLCSCTGLELRDLRAEVSRLTGQRDQLTAKVLEVDGWRQEVVAVLAALFGAAKNEMVTHGLPLEWLPTSPMGHAERVLSEQAPSLPSSGGDGR